ncbi:MAG: hypothetical protein M3413_04665 [Bacteroidota bacterium]|jgi:hypothetical protein|nr:hypothetical protein [Flavisolibacter sp.]MDQ3550800.1 hypothetical protein [Bacteroidota bacterium]
MRDKNNHVDDNRDRSEIRRSEISSENIRNANASGDGSLRRSDMLYPEKNDRYNIAEDEQEQEQNY